MLISVHSVPTRSILLCERVRENQPMLYWTIPYSRTRMSIHFLTPLMCEHWHTEEMEERTAQEIWTGVLSTVLLVFWFGHPRTKSEVTAWGKVYLQNQNKHGRQGRWKSPGDVCPLLLPYWLSTWIRNYPTIHQKVLGPAETRISSTIKKEWTFKERKQTCC